MIKLEEEMTELGDRFSKKKTQTLFVAEKMYVLLLSIEKN